MTRKIPLITLGGVFVMVAVACGKPDDASAPAAPPDAPSPPSDSLAPPVSGAPVTYRCDDLTFTAQFEGDHMTLTAPGREYMLPQAASASGARYESDKAMLWSKGSDAQVRIDGRDYQHCREDNAAEAPPAP